MEGIKIIHGGDVYTEGILKGRELLDYSSNINPLGVPESFKENINEALENVTRYPDIKYRRLKKSLSEYTGIKEDYFLLGNGAAEILDLAIATMKSILIIVPSFAEYELDAKKWGCEIHYSYLKENRFQGEESRSINNKKLWEFNCDYQDILNKLQVVQGVIIGNPNNPNGNTINKEIFKNILDYCEEHEKKVIIDEAFIEFTGDENNSLIKFVEQYKCIFIVRALTKFFGMPGIRLGYGVSSNEKLINDLNQKQNPWNINSFAEVAGTYVLKDYDYIKSTLNWIKEEREYFSEALCDITFIEKVYYTKGNFVLCKLQHMDCDKLYDLCMKKGILIRKANNYKGLQQQYVRFAIKDRNKNRIFIKALKEIERIIG